MTHIFHRHTAMDPPTATRGDGAYIVDADGKRYFDACGGAAVSCLGHSHPKVTAAIVEQAQAIAFAHTGFYTSAPAEALADLLCAAAPNLTDDPARALDRVYYVSGGSEAMEAALKLARQYYVETGRPERRHIIARRQSYHGNTLGALSAGGNMWRRAPFTPLLVEMSHIDPCFAYREQAEGESDAAYAKRAADALEAEIQRLGPETVAAFCAEPVVGATAGAVPPVADYFKRVRAICDKYDVLWIADEVMCGMGRTGFHYAYEEDGAQPDLVAIAKGLGAGYQPIGATLVSNRIYDAIRDGSGFFQHGHTYMGHPIACAAALAAQKAVIEDDLLANVRRMGDALDAALRARFGQHAHVGDIRGRGLFRALEFVADRDSKTPFEPALKLNAAVKREAMARGLMCYPMGGTVDGVRGDHVLLAPPFIIDEVDVALIVDRLGAAVDAVFASLPAQAAA
ncbi:MAG: aspartate aminotransferase family protein [Pseudomonadota bacterium]